MQTFNMLCWQTTTTSTKKMEMTFLFGFLLYVSIHVRLFLFSPFYLTSETLVKICQANIDFFFIPIQRLWWQCSCLHTPHLCMVWRGLWYWQFLLIHAKHSWLKCNSSINDSMWLQRNELTKCRGISEWNKMIVEINCNQPWKFKQIAIDLI